MKQQYQHLTPPPTAKLSAAWTTRGFESFRSGTFGNGGQNLYVSRAGVLQRIFQYDLNQNGHLDLVFCESQNHCEAAPTYIYRDPLGKSELNKVPSNGSWAGVVDDLNGDGYDDIVLGMRYNGVSVYLNAYIYYGSKDGHSERRHQRLPVPWCTAVASGDFNGDGKKDLAFLSYGRVRLFYQSNLGFEPKGYIDLKIEADQLCGADLDQDGYDELIIRDKEGNITIYWGGPKGIIPESFTRIENTYERIRRSHAEAMTSELERVDEPAALVQAVTLNACLYVSLITDQKVRLFPVSNDRQIGRPLVFDCAQALAVAAGDVNGNGHNDIVIASRQASDDEEKEMSWVYYGSKSGFSEKHRHALTTCRACDVVLADLTGDGCDDIVFCQSHTKFSFTCDSFIYRSNPDGIAQEPVRVRTEDARRVFTAKGPNKTKPELVFVNHYTRDLIGNLKNSIYFGGGKGYSEERRGEIPGWGTVECLYCDLNDDGMSDLVLANCAENSLWLDPGSYVLYNAKSGFGAEPDVVLPTKGAMGVCCADLNRDGHLDLIFSSFVQPEILIFYGNAEGFDLDNPERIRMEYEGILYNQPRWIYLADLNDNGWLDLVVPQIAFDRSFILWGGPEGYSFDRCQPLSVVKGACARAADLTGNGYLDLIIGGHMPGPRNGRMPEPAPHESFVYIYWNGPEGIREDNRTVLNADGTNCMAVADFNNDGMLDLFVGSYHNSRQRDTDSFIYWNRKDIGFRQSDFTRLFTHSASGALAADFNEDGWVDLAVANHKVWGDHQGHSCVWWNGPEGFNERKQTKLPTKGPHGISSVEPGNIMDRGPEEYYSSQAYELPPNAQLTKIHWQAEIQEKTWIRAQIRTAPTEEELATSLWRGPQSNRDYFENDQSIAMMQHGHRWVQYRLALGAINGLRTPRITVVELTYEY